MVEEADKPYSPTFADELMQMAYDWNALTGPDNSPTYWVVFEKEPKILRDFTERSLRQTFKPPAA